MSDDRDFSYDKMDNSHYSVPSFYGKIVREEFNKQPKYCEPGHTTDMQGARRNTQKGV